VIKAESHKVLNTLTELDFPDAFKKMAEALRTVHMRGRGLLFDQMAAPIPENYRLIFVVPT
jgi:hypothetical protein